MKMFFYWDLNKPNKIKLLLKGYMMNQYEKFLEDEELILSYKDKLIQYIKEECPKALFMDFENLVCWFLMNIHNTLSTVSSNLCDLSKSTYDAQVYISEIQKHQEQINNSITKDEIDAIINDSNMDDKEKLEAIKEYIDSLNML